MQSDIFFSLKSEVKTEKTALKLHEVCDIWQRGTGDISPDIPLTFNGRFMKVDALDVSKALAKRYPDCAISNMGGPELILKRPEKVRASTVILTIALSLILFFGGAVGIMSFSEDVSMDKLHSSIHTYFTGEEEDKSLWVSVPFALGVAAGFIGVLQIFRKKHKYPPTLLDVDLDEFEQQVDDYIAKRE